MRHFNILPEVSESSSLALQGDKEAHSPLFIECKGEELCDELWLPVGLLPPWLPPD